MEKKEQEIQRFLQIREGIHDEIKKIEPSVVLLQETTKRFIAHFDVFQKLSQNAQEQIKSAIKGASQEMAETMVGEFSEKVENQVQSIIGNLDQSIQNAREILDNVTKTKNKQLISMACLGCLLSTLIGVGLGYRYSKKTTYSLSKEVLEAYQLGINLQKVWPTIDSERKTKATAKKSLQK